MDALCKDYDFRGKSAPPVAGSVTGGPWARTITGAAPPTVASNGGQIDLALTATSEIQNACLSFGDDLAYDADDLIRVSFWAKLSTNELAATVQAAIGVAAARNDVIDSIAAHALFRCIGSNAVVAESDDGVHDVDDVATGMTLGTSWQKFVIDFKTGVQTRQPGLSLGGKASLQFYAGNAQGNLRRVGADTLFDLSSYAGGLQLFAQIQKTASTDLATLSIRRFRVEYREP